MTNLNPSMRLKVKRDTFFLPDPNSGVYFRNNLSSFRMEGNMIDQWVEKLMPMFNGNYSLEDLTNELSLPYRKRVYEIAEALYQNGFVRDVSQDRPHQLTDSIMEKHASQIEFLENLLDSGAYRFQVYRQTKLLAIGSGPFFVSLVSALLESGLPKFHVLITDSEQTNKRRLMELVAHARKTDPEVAIEEVTLKTEGVSSWSEIMLPYDSILYVSEEGDVEELKDIHTICREKKKVFIPAICLKQVGIAGPLVHPDSIECWESAWHRLHQSVLSKDQQLTAFSSTAGAMLANVIVFELFKKVTGVLEQNAKFFLLDLETLEGNWHSFMPHPLVTRRITAEWVQDFDMRLEKNLTTGKRVDLLLLFSQLTSAETGIFHIWEEGDLKQLPLAQCSVQVVDLLSEGPADLLQELICTGLTHAEARREAGITGIESYVSQIADMLVTTLPPIQEADGSFLELTGFVGIGAGETFAEGVCRGLQKCLDRELSKQPVDQNYSVSRVDLSGIEDERCRFYLQALTSIQGVPIIGVGKEVFGFPVIWVGANDRWYGSVGLNITGALRKALQQVLKRTQNQAVSHTTEALEVSSITLDEREVQSLKIPASKETEQNEELRSAMKILEKNHKQLLVFQPELEPFLKEGLEGVYGVMLGEEESR